LILRVQQPTLGDIKFEDGVVSQTMTINFI
jgi:hypothetical protein